MKNLIKLHSDSIKNYPSLAGIKLDFVSTSREFIIKTDMLHVKKLKDDLKAKKDFIITNLMENHGLFQMTLMDDIGL